MKIDVAKLMSVAVVAGMMSLTGCGEKPGVAEKTGATVDKAVDKTVEAVKTSADKTADAAKAATTATKDATGKAIEKTGADMQK